MDYARICEKFQLFGTLKNAEPYGCGHINSTVCLTYDENGRDVKYILQRINHSVFTDVDGLMNNISLVTKHIREKYKGNSDYDRCTLMVVPTKEGKLCCQAQDGEFYRIYRFVENTVALQAVENPEQLRVLGAAFGQFQNQLSDFDASVLVESIKNFHNTADRYRLFEEAVVKDAAGRAASVGAEIAFARSRKADSEILVGLLADGQIPLRVTHNDTKLNNLLFDKNDFHAVCVIDLDTVMPGLVHYDFGDSIRFGAATAAEDETDLSKVEMDIKLFETFTDGFLSSCGDRLTETEINYLAFSAKLITYECGIRFLTDYLNGDTYFKTDYEGQNLDRCRMQFKLVSDMEQKMEKMEAIVEKIAQKYRT